MTIQAPAVSMRRIVSSTGAAGWEVSLRSLSNKDHRPGKRGVTGKLNDPRQRKERMSAQPMAKHEMPLVEILPEFFSIYQNQRLAALACGLRRHIENTRHAPRISIFSSPNKTPVRINRGLLNDNQIPALPLSRGLNITEDISHRGLLRIVKARPCSGPGRDGSGGKKLKPAANR